MGIEFRNDVLQLLPPHRREIAKLVATGLTNQDIADDLGISINTVKTEVTRSYDRLGVCNRVQLTHRIVSRYV